MSHLFAWGSDLIFKALTPRRLPRPNASGANSRILCLSCAGVAALIDTLPLLHALRRHFPRAHLTVACDLLGAPIAEACKAVDEVVVLHAGWNPWLSLLKNAARLRDYDWAVAATADFDLPMARLARLTNAPIRIGIERRADRRSAFYTDPVVLPAASEPEHQIDSLLRLLRPLGLIRTTHYTVDFSLNLPVSARGFASAVLDGIPSASSRRLLLINVSGAHPVKFREEDFITLASRLLGSTDLVIGFVGTPLDQQKRQEIAACMGSRRITAIEVPGPLELAALLENSAFLITPEGAAAHLAASVGTPALVLWSEGLFKKCHSRGKRHAFVHAQGGEQIIPVERVWQAVQPFLVIKEDDMEQKWTDLLEVPAPPSDLLH